VVVVLIEEVAKEVGEAKAGRRQVQNFIKKATLVLQAAQMQIWMLYIEIQPNLQQCCQANRHNTPWLEVNI
jgi:hypothetical protein